MKLLITLLLCFLPLMSKNIYFTQSSSSIDELEAKIITQIANAFLYKPQIYVIGGDIQLAKYLAKYSNLKLNCSEANFVYIKKASKDMTVLDKCTNANTIFFTDDKNNFKRNPNIIGAFFWLKSRPNVKLSLKRAQKLNIKIPKNYFKFVDNQ